MKFKKKPIVVDAYQWFKVSEYVEGEDRDVDYFRHPKIHGSEECQSCGYTMHDHGWIDTLEGGHTVCVGDWVITGIFAEKYPCKPYVFEATYEKVEEDENG